MFTYYIAGVPKCLDFGHAIYIAEKLKHSLLYFSYEVIVKTEEEYQNWSENFCSEQKWKNYNNPLIWKRIRNSSGSCQLIGGMKEFFALLTEYYGIDTHLDKRIKKKIELDNQMRMKFMLTNQNMPVCRATPRRVCVTGAVYSTTIYLVSELLQLEQLHTEGGVIIYLHHKDTKKYSGFWIKLYKQLATLDLIKIKNELRDAEFNIHGHRVTVVVNSLEEGLINCDLLIVIGTVNRLENEDQYLWMNRHYRAMMSLASELNKHCPEKCKVMLMGMDLLCFNLSVLAEYATKVYLYNFVGVTDHYGMEILPTISETTGIQMSDLHCPPVWGYIGLEKYVDINHTIYCCSSGSTGVCTDVATTIMKHSHTVNITETHKYLHSHSVFLHYEGLAEEIATNSHGKQNNSTQSECPLKCLPEICAALRLLSEWFGNGNNSIISAAVLSDGTFGLPFGMFMSQPVTMENGEWKPNYNFPSLNEKNLINIITRGKEIAYEYNLGERFQKKLKESISKISE